MIGLKKKMANLTYITQETKNYLADIFTTYYFYPSSQNKLTLAKRFQNFVDYYLKVEKITKKPIELCSRHQMENERKEILREYWLSNFDFLLDNPSVVKNINESILNKRRISINTSYGLIKMLGTFIMLEAIRDTY